jgi:pSer/pThr/pTyr-binding forkhead associated (FHA) protein
MRRLVFVEREPVAGRVVPIVAEATIGREGCDILLPDPEASRRHAALTQREEDPVIEDLGSTNGTFVNGVRIEEPTALREGDAVRLGNTIWHVTAPGAATRVATLPSTPEPAS